jgi:hypothetical protein
MRESLERAAEESGRSLAQEIERRLEESFHLEEIYGSGHTAALLRMLKAAIDMVETTNEKTFCDNELTAIEAQSALKRLIDMMVVAKGDPDAKDYRASFTNMLNGRADLALELRRRSKQLGKLTGEIIADYIKDGKIQYKELAELAERARVARVAAEEEVRESMARQSAAADQGAAAKRIAHEHLPERDEPHDNPSDKLDRSRAARKTRAES